MIASDPFCTYYADFLAGRYDCVDRIVLNAYFSLACSPGGMRCWWRALHGTDDNLDNAHLMRMAGHFSRCVRGWAKKNGIPVIDCRQGDRKHEMGEELLATTPKHTGIFAVFVNKAPFPIWDVQRYGQGGINLRRKDPAPYVNHYSFHIWDADWGHVTIKLCGHPPFTAQIILNGHEYVAQQATQQRILFVKEDNCFTAIADAPGLQQVADTLRSPDAIGRLTRVCERWLYQCLCFALTPEEQAKTAFRYSLSVYQAEYSRNLLFQRGRDLDQIFQAVIDRTRGPLTIKTIKTIFGCKQRPQRQSKAPRWEVVVEKPVYDLTVFRIHCGHLTLKMYTKGEHVLRIEVIVHNARGLRGGTGLLKFPKIVTCLQDVLERFLEVVGCADTATLDDGTFEQLPTPSQVGKARVSGVDMNKERMTAAMEGVLALSTQPDGFTSGQLAVKVREIKGWSEQAYRTRHAAYDLKKLRGKNLIQKQAQSRRYQAPAAGLRTMVAVGVLRDKVLKPVLSGNWRTGRPPKNPRPLDEHYQFLRKGMRKLCQALRIVA